MKIDIVPQKITVKDSIYTGKRYCFCYASGEINLGEPNGWYDNRYDWKNAMSVLWTAKELDKFLPNDTVHSVRARWTEQMNEEIIHLTKCKRREPKVWKCPRTGEVVNVKERIQDKIDFLKANRIDFVEITFVNTK